MSGGTWDGSRRRTLAEKIANSTCKICGARGHWRRECPNNPDREDLGHHKKEVTHLTLEVDQPADAEMLQDYGDSVPYGFDGEPDFDDEDCIGARQTIEGARIQVRADLLYDNTKGDVKAQNRSLCCKPFVDV